MKKKLKISVVVGTYNRGETFPITLQCLANQTLDFSFFEVIVIDDGSSDNTEQVVQSYKENFPFNLRYYRHHPNRGVCYTQNSGIRSARASIVVLIADDIQLAPGALEAHLQDHERNPDPSVVILGKVMQSEKLGEISVFLKNWDPFKFHKLNNLRELPYYLFWACNISFKRDFLMKNGLFNEEMVQEGTNGHEDPELGYRLSKKGLRILYNQKALGYHYHIVTLDQAVRKYYHSGQTWTNFRRIVNRPEITVRYHVLGFSTLKDYFHTFRHSNNLIGADKYPLLLFVRHAVFAALFNFISVPFFWMPLMNGAEKKPMFAHLMHAQLYRGVLFHHFIRGVRHNRKGFYSKEYSK